MREQDFLIEKEICVDRNVVEMDFDMVSIAVDL